MPIEAIEPRRLYQQVARQLRSLIEAGEYPVGSRLPPERDLAVQLGVSRPTLREALIALEVDGRIRIRVGSGIYVETQGTKPMPGAAEAIAGPFEILKARALFEGAVAEEAAGIITPHDIAALHAIVEDMRSASHPGEQSIVLDRAFHTGIAAILGNDAVTKVVGDLFDQRINPYFTQLASYFENTLSWEAAADEHAAIIERLAMNDGAGARRAMAEHLRFSEKRFSSNFGEPVQAMPGKAGAAGIRPKRLHSAST